MRQKKAAAKREIFIVARYFILKNHGKYQVGDVVLLVRNDKQVEYLVTIRPDGEHACSCPATKKCYHLTECIAIEDARETVPARELAPLNGNRPFSFLAKERAVA